MFLRMTWLHSRTNALKPDRIIRHPAYLGLILLFTGMPLSLGSVFACIPSLAAIFLVIIRTGLEDQFLKKHLPGFGNYAMKTRFRLLPGIW